MGTRTRSGTARVAPWHGDRNRPLIVCHCKVVTDRSIRAAVDQGALDVEEIGRHCAAGTHCGGCRSSIAALLATLLAGEHEQPAA